MQVTLEQFGTERNHRWGLAGCIQQHVNKGGLGFRKCTAGRSVWFSGWMNSQPRMICQRAFYKALLLILQPIFVDLMESGGVRK